VLILLMWWIYELVRWDCFMWRDIHTKFHEDRHKCSSNINVITETIWEAAVLVLLMGRDIWNTPLRWAKMAWYT
jgi:hypothetical protein